MNEPNITRRSLRDRRVGKTNWDQVDSQLDTDVAELAISGEDSAPTMTDEWLARAEVVQPNKRLISIRLDEDVLGFFQEGGKNYQTRINQVLRTYVEARKRSA